VGAANRRLDGRAPDELRSTSLEPGFVRSADGSVLVSVGETVLICTASVGRGVPSWREPSGKGWVTAEYGMLPASTGERRPREAVRGRLDGRTVEIQRLIGRSLRGAVDFTRLGPRTVVIDCDVVQADGGTRCAAITGGYVALELALSKLVERGELASPPLTTSIAAVSCGLVDGTPMLDLCYREDVGAEVDMNVVMTGDGELVEVQATGERISFSRASLDELLGLAAAGIERLREDQVMAVRRAAGAGKP
jgi:ribonuclease PH